MAAGKRKSDGLNRTASPPRKRHSLSSAEKASSAQSEIFEDDASPREKRGDAHESHSESLDDPGGLEDDGVENDFDGPDDEEDEVINLDVSCEACAPQVIESYEPTDVLEAMAQFYNCLEQVAIEAMRVPDSFDRPLAMPQGAWLSMISEQEGNYLRVSWSSDFNLQDEMVKSSPRFDPMEKAPRAISLAVFRLLQLGVQATGEDKDNVITLRNGVKCYVLPGNTCEGSLVAIHFIQLHRKEQEAVLARMKEYGQRQAQARAIEEARDRAMSAAKPTYKKRIPPPIVDSPAALRIEAMKRLRCNQTKEAGTWHLETRRIEETGKTLSSLVFPIYGYGAA